MTKISLYEVALEGMQIEDILIANDGELTPELEERLDALLKEGPKRIEAAAMVVRTLELSAEACKEEAKRLTDRKASLEGQADRLKKRIVVALDAAFNGKVRTDLFTVWAQNAADQIEVELSPEFTLEMLKEDHPELVETKLSIKKDPAKAIWKQHGQEALTAHVILSDPEATKDQKEAAQHIVSLIPEGLTFTDKPGVRYCRIK